MQAKFFLPIALIVALCAPAPSHADDAPKTPEALAAFKANFREKGRFGLLGAITDEEWKGGVVFEHEYFEAQALAHAAFQSKNNLDVHVVYKLGGRTALGALNYLAYGLEYAHHPGARDQGVSLKKDYYVAPYISLQRYFAATPIMMVLWVNPVQYYHGVSSDGAGQAVTTKATRVFQTGGFGLAYLFF